MKHNTIFCRFMKMMGNRLPNYLFAIFMMTTFNAIFDVVTSIFIKRLFDIAQKGESAGLYFELSINIVAALVSIIVAVIFMNIYNNEAKRASIEIKQKVFAKSMRLPMKYYDMHHSGEMISRLVFDTDKASEIYSSRLRRVLAPIISVLVYIFAMVLLNPAMTFVLIVLNALLFLFNTCLSKPMKQIARDMAIHNAIMVEKLSNLIAGIEIWKLYDNEHKTEKQYIHANEKFVETQKKKMCLSGLLESFNVGFDLLCALMFLVVGVYFLQNGMVTIGEIVAIYTMYGALSFHFLQLGKYYPELMNCIAYAQRIFEFMDEEEETDIIKQFLINESNENIESEYSVEIQNLEFAYDDNHQIFNNVSLVIPKENNVALTGKTGCGKSTLAKLMLGFYPYEVGDIKLFGKSVKALGVERVRSLIAYVPQEPYLFETTIMQNIRYGKPTASGEEVVKAAKDANAHEFILKQKDGYNTIVSNRGQSLSGGERQRIAIARAILKNAPIILLDEATSALDNESEQLILEVIVRLKKSKTIIMIAHRQATIELADTEVML